MQLGPAPRLNFARSHLGSQGASVQGINRLGKAAPKPGSLRPPDPNRRQDLDLFSEGAETDADYMRMVHDVRPSEAKLSATSWNIGSPSIFTRWCRLKTHNRTRVDGFLVAEVITSYSLLHAAACCHMHIARVVQQ